MRKSGFSLTRVLPYKDRVYDSVLIRENTVNENPYSRIFYAVTRWKTVPPFRDEI